jgi:hypothetical protein
MAHTFGPWGYTYDGSSDWSIGPVADPQAEQVARVWDKNDERARAKASLIAAAPEMLAMLKRLEWSREERALSGGNLWCCPICIEAGMGGHHKPDCELAAIIAKAKGK